MAEVVKPAPESPAKCRSGATIGADVDLNEFNNAAVARALAEQGLAEPAKDVRVYLRFSVEDDKALWDAATQKALTMPGMRLEDVVDVIGPRDDPAIAECIAMLVGPVPLPGCALVQFEVGKSLAGRYSDC